MNKPRLVYRNGVWVAQRIVFRHIPLGPMIVKRLSLIGLLDCLKILHGHGRLENA